MEDEATVECVGGPLDGQRVPYSGDVYDQSRLATPLRAGEELNPQQFSENEVRTHRYTYDEAARVYRHEGRIG